VVAAYNAAPFIARAVQSALAQTGIELEVVVVDDGSTDDTVAVVEALDDQRIRCQRAPRNGGPAAARNLGFSLARHDWVAVLDADDAISPGRLSTLIGAAQAVGADIIADNFWIETPGQADRRFIDEPQDGAVLPVGLAEFLSQNLLFRTPRPLGYLKPVFRRAFLAEYGLAYDTSLRIGEDAQLIIEALLKGGRYVRHRSTGYHYLTREGSISHRLTSEQAAAMAGAERRVTEPVRDRLSPAEVAVLDKQLASLDTGAAFIACIERLKRGDILGAVALVLQRPQIAPHFMMPLRARLGAMVPKPRGASFR
jgi:succinoglycan biosynthesis protein ExoO